MNLHSDQHNPRGERFPDGELVQQSPSRMTADLHALEERGRARRSIPLSGLFTPFVVVGTGLWNMVMRLVRYIVAAVGRKFQLGADVSSTKPGEATAHLTAPGSSPADVVNVEEAAREITQQSETAVATILASKPDLARLAGPQALAYASLRLQEIGGAIEKMRAQLDTEYVALHMQIKEQAQKVGLNVDQLTSYLKDSALDDEELRRDFPASLLDAYDRHSRLRSDICSLQLQFCTFAIAALRKDQSTEQEGYVQALESLISRYADEDMKNIIHEQIGQNSDNSSRAESAIDGLSGIQSGKHNTQAAADNVAYDESQASPVGSEHEVATLPTALSRAKRFAVGVDPGHEQGVDAQDEPRVVERQR